VLLFQCIVQVVIVAAGYVMNETLPCPPSNMTVLQLRGLPAAVKASCAYASGRTVQHECAGPRPGHHAAAEARRPCASGIA
jgi:hypothetical protein